MQRFLVAIILGAFNNSPAPTNGPAIAPPPPPLTMAVPVVSIREMEAVRDEEIRKAHAAVRRETRPKSGGVREHRFIFADGSKVVFTDRPRRGRSSARRAHVVSFIGGESASQESHETFAAAGRTFNLPPQAVEALRYVSRHEGGFDAINTWDSARFSWGFIQFAGGYGLRPALGHLKEMSPELFREMLAVYGVDVEKKDGAYEPIFRDPKSGEVLRGKDAEQAYGDRPEIIAAFIRAGRHPEVKQRQLETAVREYAIPALAADFRGVRVADLLKSPQALAMLIDRQVQEGNILRLQRALEHVTASGGITCPKALARLESRVLDIAVQDAAARTSVRNLLQSAGQCLDRAAAGAPSLNDAHSMMVQALRQAQQGMTVGLRRDSVVAGVSSLLPQLGSAGADDLRTMSARVRDMVGGMTYEDVIWRRLHDIRRSELSAPAA